MNRPFYFFILAFFLMILFPVNVLIVSDGNSSHDYILGEKNITIFYIHSVERSEIYEGLKVNRTGIYAVEMKWKDFGAGLPEDIQYMENGYYVKKINIYLGKSLDFWFIPLNRAQISVDGSIIFAPKTETLMKFEVKRCLLIQALLGRC
ncbi:hypothetical protein A3L02_09830 [Thermococcus celer Vu 13 = JCM 8558]|uniref:DUF1850 domain-containing protein n=2 Tax=Thermococcus celer TaxID=2264 RepID=A0A218P4H7_THECE|nr:hypothetical protein A3L02_09830 [Thermococcus celer Vu 13 = JCM 8558]